MVHGAVVVVTVFAYQQSIQALSVIYRMLHDGYPTALQEFFAQTAYIDDIGREAVSLLIGQFCC